MFVLTVIPISKSIRKDSLNYFSAEKVSLGSIVSIPVRSKNIDALVVGVEDAKNLKLELRTAKFELKKIKEIKKINPFSLNFFEACHRMSQYSLVNTGAIIKSLLPKVFLDNPTKLLKPKEIDLKNTNIRQEKLISQLSDNDRLGWYRTLIREAFAKNESVFICVPTRFDIQKIREALEKGIEKYIYTFQSNSTKKTLISSYNKCLEEKHPVTIIGTGMFLSIPRHDIKTIIVENENSDSYKQFIYPYIDIRTFAETYASINKIKIILADTLLRPETYHRYENGELQEASNLLFRFPKTKYQLIVDMKKEEKNIVLSETVKKMISYSLEENESTFLFTIRKGMAGLTVCNDCGHTLLCENCSTPMVLYGEKQRSATKNERGRTFMCNKCGLKKETEIRCSNCNSWNLNPLGVGTDKVYLEIKKEFPKAQIFQIDKETISNEKEIKKVIDEFNKKKGILIGTEMAFLYLQQKIEHSAVISLDGLFSIPSFNITQKIVQTIQKLHSVTKDDLIIQTRNPDNRILNHIVKGNVLPIYREDLEERKQFNYPPFKRLLKITFAGTAQETEKARNFLEKILKKYDPQIFSAFIGKVKGQYITNTVIKVDSKSWPLPLHENIQYDQYLIDSLTKLPPSFKVNVDPVDLL
ncbi:MAG: hypothetical protein U9R00_00655 [Patescibacteria group bacterium]|nr:hypothetical protein [Patescibacteria group bacterium]